MNDEGVRIRRAESVRMKRKGCWIYEEKQQKKDEESTSMKMYAYFRTRQEPSLKDVFALLYLIEKHIRSYRLLSCFKF